LAWVAGYRPMWYVRSKTVIHPSTNRPIVRRPGSNSRPLSRKSDALTGLPATTVTIVCIPKLSIRRVYVLCVKPRPHQQQHRNNIVECYKSNDSFDEVECCFDIQIKSNLFAINSVHNITMSLHCVWLDRQAITSHLCLPVFAVFGNNTTMSNEISSFRQSRNKLNMFSLFRLCQKN